MSCLENHISDIVRMEIYLDRQCTFPIPFNVSSKSMALAEGALSGTPVAAFSLSPDDGEFVMADYPTVKVSDTRQSAGVVYEHDIQLSVTLRRAEVVNALEPLYLQDFHVVFTRDDNTKWLSRSLPNTSVCNTENMESSSSSLAIKIKLYSLSALIALS